MPWSEKHRKAMLDRIMRDMLFGKNKIQTALDRGWTHSRIAQSLGVNRKYIGEFILGHDLKAFSDLGIRHVCFGSMRYSGGLHDGTPQRGAILFRKHPGKWYVCITAYKMRAFLKQKTALAKAEKELLKLKAEVAVMKIMVDKIRNGGSYGLDTNDVH